MFNRKMLTGGLIGGKLAQHREDTTKLDRQIRRTERRARSAEITARVHEAKAGKTFSATTHHVTTAERLGRKAARLTERAEQLADQREEASS